MATDSTYEQQLAALQARQGNEQASTDFQDTQIESGYGFDPKYANDPYTKANMLARAASARFSRSTNSYASKVGGLYGGALNQQRSQDEFQTGFDRDQVLREYAAAKQGITDKRNASNVDYQSGAINAFQSMQDRLNATPAAPVEPAGGAGGGGGPGPGEGGTNQQAVQKAKAILANPKGKSHAAITWAHSILGK